MPRVEVQRFSGVSSAALDVFRVWSGAEDEWVIVPRPFRVRAFDDKDLWGVALDVVVDAAHDHLASRHIAALPGYPLLTHRRLQDLPLKAVLVEAVTTACVRVQPGPSTHARNVWVEAGEPVTVETAERMLAGSGRSPSASRRLFEQEFIRNDWDLRRPSYDGSDWYLEVGQKIGLSRSGVYNHAVEMGLLVKRSGRPRL